MPWRPLPRIAVAVAIYPFRATLPADLPLEIGDDLYIIEQGGRYGDWFRGYLVAPPSLLSGLTSVKGQTLEARVFSGIFPRCCVDIREHLGDPLPDSQVNGSLTNGNDSNHDLERTDSTRRRTPPPSQLSKLQRRDSSDSHKRRNGLSNGDSEKDARASPRLMRTPSQILARKLSHRSITSSRSRHSPAPSAPPLDAPPRDSNAKRPQAPVPMLKIGDETPTSSSEPLVDEIASSLREWHSKNLHELLLSRRYVTLEKLAGLVRRLNTARRQLLYGVMTDRELHGLREETVWDLVGGNKMLSNEVIVRDPSQRGRLLTGDDSPIEMSKLQSSMSLLDRPPRFPVDPISLHHLLIELKGVAYHGLVAPSLVFQLYGRKGEKAPRPLTECFSVDVPTNEDFERLASAGLLRTLFTDLTSADLEANTQSGDGLYLVIRAQANFAAKELVIENEDAASINRPATASTLGTNSVKGGRQSLMWAQKPFGSVRRIHSSRPSQSPTVSEEAVPKVNGVRPPPSRAPTQDALRPATQPGALYFKRSIGIGFIDLRPIFDNKVATEQRVLMWNPKTSPPNSGKHEDEYGDDMIRDLVCGPNGAFTKAHGIENVHLALQSFEHLNAQDLIAKTPTLLQNTTPTPKTAFSGTPSKPRSDIYVKISKVSLPPNAILVHPERGTVPLDSTLELNNVQLTLEVRKRNGDRIERCIFPSSNSSGQTAWRTTAASRDERWNQLIKIALPAEDVAQSHLIMSIADAPRFPFALGWIPLWFEGAFIPDGAHAPLLYVYDKSTSNSIEGRGAYLSLPWSSKRRDGSEREEGLTGPVVTVKLETRLCSTYLSQDKVLIGILKWRQQQGSELLDLLKRFSFVPEIEIVKMITDVFDALFGILSFHSGKYEFEDGVFNALVTVLGIVYDRRFNLGPSVDEYADLRFNHPGVASCLIRSYLRLLENVGNAKESRLLRATFKVGRQVIKFISRARERQALEEAAVGASSELAFKRELKTLFEALEKLMRDPALALIGNKTLVVQHLPSWLPELKVVFSQTEIFETATSFLASCADVQGKLVLHKLVLILNLAGPHLFSDAGIRENLSLVVPQWISQYWGFTTEMSNQWRDQVRLCCSIASVQASESTMRGSIYVSKTIQSYNALLLQPHKPNGTLSLLFPKTYPFPSKPASSNHPYDEVGIELAALLASFDSASLQVGKGRSTSEASAIASAALEVVTSILTGTTFPTSWLSLYVYHHRSMLRILEGILDLMTTALLPSPEDADDFNTELWRKFLVTLLTLVSSDALALETFPEQKRRAVWKVAGDVREQGARLLRRSWEMIGWDTNAEEQARYKLERLGGFQVQYVPKLVGPVVGLCLSVHEGLRSVAIRILQAMIISEWTLNEDLSVVQAEMVNSLDALFKSRSIGESMVQKMFINELLDSFEQLARMPLDPLWQSIRDMVSTVDELLELLGAVHSHEVSENLRVMNTLQLMNFLRDMQKEDIFIRYVHQLADTQVRSGNRTEAGLALALHAEQYSWDMVRVVQLLDPPFPEQSSFERKEQLYFKMIKYFEDGGAWDNALSCYQDLAAQYETTYYDFAKLARTQRSMATVYDTLSRGDWQGPRYYRVLYHGVDFPSSLRDRQFVYEAGSNERQSSFADRLRQLHPAAQIVTKGEIERNEGQSLQVFPVNVYRDLQHPIFQQPRVAQTTRDFVTSSKPHRFAITSKRHSPVSGVQDQWIEKTIFSTQDAFPTILRRSEIIAIDVVRLTPQQTAVERTTRKSSELAALERRLANGDESAASQYYEAIAFSVDNGSLASVSQYRKLLLSLTESDEEDDEEVQETLDPAHNTLQIALLDHVSLLKHCLSHCRSPTYESTHDALVQQFNATFSPEISMLTPPTQSVEDNTHELLSSPPRSSADFSPTNAALTQSSAVDLPTSATDQQDSQVISRPRPFSRLSFNVLKGSFGSSSSRQQQPTQEIHQMNGSISALSDDSRASSRNNSMKQPPSFIQNPNGSYTSHNNSITNGTTLPLDRPPTSQSNSSKSFVSNSGGKVRRRLSQLGIGRTGSGASNGGAGRREKSRENARVESIQE